jgi:hypothetical protein
MPGPRRPAPLPLALASLLLGLSLLGGCWQPPTDAVAVRPSAPLLADDAEGAAVVGEAPFSAQLKVSQPRFGQGAFLRVELPGCDPCFVRAADVAPLPLQGTPMWVAGTALQLKGGKGEPLRVYSLGAEVSAVAEAPWLQPGQVIVVDEGRPQGFAPRAALSAVRPGAGNVVAHTFEALGALDFQRARDWLTAGSDVLTGRPVPPEEADLVAELRTWLDVHTSDERREGPAPTTPRGGRHDWPLKAATPVTEPGPAFVGTALAPLREARSRRTRRLGTLAANTPVRVLAVNGAWARVSAPASRRVQDEDDVVLDWEEDLAPALVEPTLEEAGGVGPVVAQAERAPRGASAGAAARGPTLAAAGKASERAADRSGVGGAGATPAPQEAPEEEVTGYVERALLTPAPLDAGALAAAAREAGVSREQAVALLTTAWAVAPEDRGIGEALLAHAVALREPRLAVETAAALRDLERPAVTLDVQLVAGCRGNPRRALVLPEAKLTGARVPPAVCVTGVELPVQPGRCGPAEGERNFTQAQAAQAERLEAFERPALRVVLRNRRRAPLALPGGGLHVARVAGPHVELGGEVSWGGKMDAEARAPLPAPARVPPRLLRPSSTTVYWLTLDAYGPQALAVSPPNAPRPLEALQASVPLLAGRVTATPQGPSTWREGLGGVPWLVVEQRQGPRACGG